MMSSDTVVDVGVIVDTDDDTLLPVFGTSKRRNRTTVQDDPPGNHIIHQQLVPKKRPSQRVTDNNNKNKNNNKLCRRSPWEMVLDPCLDFLHARTGVQGCRLAGMIRVCYASLYLYSILLLTLQMPTLFDPRQGLLPYFLSGDDAGAYQYSVFQVAPDSSLLVWVVFLGGLSSGVLLLLGIQPRWGAVGCFFFLHNLSAHNHLMWDHEFYMNRMWSFFLIFLPLDHITLHDGFGGLLPLLKRKLRLWNIPCISPYLQQQHQQQSHQQQQQQHQQQQQQALNVTTSWPMWPFRLWQIYTCMIYLGAGLGKLNTRPWQQGTALSWCWYDEGIGRFYPNFVIELLYNRMLPIQIQTYLSLVIEVLCVVTIWPIKTRKMTFIAIVFLHIGIELCLLMHIFEYLSVLGWVCFFVYPNDNDNDNKSKPESSSSSSASSILAEKEKSDKGKGTSSAVSSSSSLYGPTKLSRKKIIIDTVVAVALLYLLIRDIFPFQQVTQLLPTVLSQVIFHLVHPPRFMGHRLTVLSHTIGIHTGPYILFAGKPPHAQARLTAVIRFTDGTDPILYQDAEWADSSYFQRELDYWLDAYLYYLYRGDGFDRGRIPYYATLAVHLAERYSHHKIHRDYSKIAIDFDNTVESVSLQLHKRTGSERPPSPELGHFESIPRDWTYASQCRYVFLPNETVEESHSDHQQHYVNIKSDKLRLQNGCVNYNPADEVLHRKGKYGEKEEVGGGGGGDDSTAVEENNNRYQVQHYQPRLRHQQQKRQYPPQLHQQHQQQQQQHQHQHQLQQQPQQHQLQQQPQPQQQQERRRRNEWQKQ